MIQFSAILASLAVFSFGRFVFGLELPAPLQKCKFNEEKCMIDTANMLVRTFPHGLAALEWPDMEPLHFEKVSLVGDPKSPANINLDMKDAKFHNFSNIIFTKIRGFSKDTTKPMKILITTSHPKIILKSKYKTTGRILVLPITGDGDLEWDITDTASKIKQTLETEQREGKTYLKMKDFKITTKSKHIKINLTNLFNGDKALSDAMLSLINENWETLAAEIQPLVDREIEKAYSNFFKKIYENMPYDELFLMDKE